MKPDTYMQPGISLPIIKRKAYSFEEQYKTFPLNSKDALTNQKRRY
jgi:hypothetical protein